MENADQQIQDRPAVSLAGAQQPRSTSSNSEEPDRRPVELDTVSLKEKYKGVLWTRVFSLQQQYANVETTWPLSTDLIDELQKTESAQPRRAGASCLLWDPRQQPPTPKEAFVAEFALPEAEKARWGERVTELRARIQRLTDTMKPGEAAGEN